VDGYFFFRVVQLCFIIIKANL